MWASEPLILAHEWMGVELRPSYRTQRNQGRPPHVNPTPPLLGYLYHGVCEHGSELKVAERSSYFL